MKLNLRWALFLVLVASVFALGWNSQRAVSPKFEYKMVKINMADPQMDTAALNQIGADGWELVTVMTGTAAGNTFQTDYFFKREKR